jgi:hypothetical protein
MKKIIVTALAALSVAGVANADVYVHGRSGDRNNPAYYNTNPANGSTAKGVAAKYVSNRLTAATVNTDRRYWSNQATFYGFASLDGANFDGKAKSYFNWDGVSEVVTNATVVNALRNNLPAGGSITRTHSTGGLINARLLNLYGTSAGAKGGWVARSVAAASAEGGSEMADTGATWYGGVMGNLAGVTTWPVDTSLRTPNARSFTHNFAGSPTYHGGGYNSDPEAGLIGSGVAAWTLPGEDDGAVAYHSTLGKAVIGRFCNTAYWYTVGCDTGRTWNNGENYSGHSPREYQYWGHGFALQFAARGW